MLGHLMNLEEQHHLPAFEKCMAQKYLEIWKHPNSRSPSCRLCHGVDDQIPPCSKCQSHELNFYVRGMIIYLLPLRAQNEQPSPADIQILRDGLFERFGPGWDDFSAGSVNFSSRPKVQKQALVHLMELELRFDKEHHSSRFGQYWEQMVKGARKKLYARVRSLHWCLHEEQHAAKHLHASDGNCSYVGCPCQYP